MHTRSELGSQFPQQFWGETAAGQFTRYRRSTGGRHTLSRRSLCYRYCWPLQAFNYPQGRCARVQQHRCVQFPAEPKILWRTRQLKKLRKPLGLPGMLQRGKWGMLRALVLHHTLQKQWATIGLCLVRLSLRLKRRMRCPMWLSGKQLRAPSSLSAYVCLTPQAEYWCLRQWLPVLPWRLSSPSQRRPRALVFIYRAVPSETTM